MRIQVRKCPFTGKIFEEKDIGKYIIHLRDLRAEMKVERRQTQIKKNWARWLKKEKEKITHPDQIIEWFMKNQQYIMDAFNAGCRHKHWHGFDSDRFHKTDRFENVRLSRSLVYSPLVSNSHSCPDNGISNFMTENGKPLGYPGWTGYINGTLVRAKKHSGSYPYGNALNLVGIKTGSGGGGNENWGYDFRIFLADWPGLNEEVRRMEENEILRRLKGK